MVEAASRRFSLQTSGETPLPLCLFGLNPFIINHETRRSAVKTSIQILQEAAEVAEQTRWKLPIWFYPRHPRERFLSHRLGSIIRAHL